MTSHKLAIHLTPLVSNTHQNSFAHTVTVDSIKGTVNPTKPSAVLLVSGQLHRPAFQIIRC